MSETIAAPHDPAGSPDEAAEAEPFAGFWRRVAAVVIDNLVLIAPMIAVSYLVHALLGLLLILFYGAFFESSAKRATLGKMACGIFVVTLDGGRLGFGRALGRQVLKLLGNVLSVISWLIFFLPAMFTRRHQGLHDLAVSSVVRRHPGKGIPDAAVAIIGGIVPVLFVAATFAAIAIPAYNDYLARARIAAVLVEARAYQAAIEKYHAGNRKMPAGLQDLGMGEPSSPDVKSFSLRDGRIVVEPAHRGSPGVLILTPTAAGGTFSWTCTADGLPIEALPPGCRG